MSETTEKPFLETLETPAGISETFFNKLVGINDAATISKASKGQLSKDSNAGRIAFITNDKGHKQYKVSDLYQKYGFRNQAEASTEKPEKPQEPDAETIKSAVEVAVLKERVSRLEDEVRDLRGNRDRLLDQNNRLTMLLAPPAVVPPVPQQAEPAHAAPAEELKGEPPPQSLPWYKRLFK